MLEIPPHTGISVSDVVVCLKQKKMILVLDAAFVHHRLDDSAPSGSRGGVAWFHNHLFDFQIYLCPESCVNLP